MRDSGHQMSQHSTFTPLATSLAAAPDCQSKLVPPGALLHTVHRLYRFEKDPVPSFVYHNAVTEQPPTTLHWQALLILYLRSVTWRELKVMVYFSEE